MFGVDGQVEVETQNQRVTQKGPKQGNQTNHNVTTV